MVTAINERTKVLEECTKNALNKPSKRGFTSLAIPGHDPPIDLTIFVDIAVNPGPSPTLVSSFNSTASSAWPSNLHTGSSRFNNSTLPRISYNRRFLMGLRPCSVKPSLSTLKSLKSFGILKFRGKIAGRRKIRTLISDRSTSVSSASLRTNVNRCNLITIPLQSQSNDCAQKRQQALSNFALINSRSIRNKTLLLNDYVSEHNIDILALPRLGFTTIISILISVVIFVPKDFHSVMSPGHPLKVAELVCWSGDNSKLRKYSLLISGALRLFKFF